jgi:hypothetical protein
MAKITKFLNGFQDGTSQSATKTFGTASFLNDIYIANTGTVDATVTCYIAAQGVGDAFLFQNLVIPVGVTLDALQGNEIRLLNGKGAIVLENWADSNADIDVTYITS